jgi:two-component sensor histidine kinase
VDSSASFWHGRFVKREIKRRNKRRLDAVGSARGCDANSKTQSTAAAQGAICICLGVSRSAIVSGLDAPQPAARAALLDVTGRFSGLRFTLALIAAYACAALLLVPFAGLPGPVVPGLSAFFAAGVFVTELSTAFLLFVRFRETRQAALLALACRCLYSALMTIPYLLTFPDAVLRDGPLLGTPRSSAWIFAIWILGFALLTLAAVVLEAWFKDLKIPRSGSVVSTAIALITAAVAAIAMLSIMRPEWLPDLVGPRGWTGLDHTLVAAALSMMFAGACIVLLVSRGRSELFLWLALALTVLFFGNLLSQIGAERYTIGWSVSRLSWVFSGSILFLYFMSQFVRQQRLLGRSRDALERAVTARTADLTDMVGQRDLLLREVHHRVKNNFQVINSLISFQAGKAETEETKSALLGLHSRIYALGLVHQRLMQSDNLATFDIRAFLRDLCNNVAALSSAAEREIMITAEADPLQTDLDFAGPLGLLVTELVSAAFEHFGEGQHGVIHVALHGGPDSQLILDVSDDAPRAPDAPDALSSGPRARIVHALVAQLSGTFEREHENGTRVRVTMRIGERGEAHAGTR